MRSPASQRGKRSSNRATPSIGEQHLGDEETERDGRSREEEVPGDQGEEEGDDRMTLADETVEPLCWPAGMRLEEWNGVPVVLRSDDRHARVHGTGVGFQRVSFPLRDDAAV